MADANAPVMPVRPFWSGTITFGLVSIPVNLLAAARARQKSMKLVDTQGHPLGRRYYCPKDNKVLSDGELIHGYETKSGKMVVISGEEFESAAPEKSRDIELKRFVSLNDIPPAFFDHPYYLAPDERAGKAYALLAQTMAKSGKAGIGSFVMHGHEYLVAIVSDNGVLRAEVLHYADELRTAESIGLPKAKRPDANLVRKLGEEIESLSRPGLNPSEMEDIETEQLRKFAQRKAKAGKGVIRMEDLEDPDADDAGGGGEIIDLVQILRKSLGATASRAMSSGQSSMPTKHGAAKKGTRRKSAAETKSTLPKAKKKSPT